MATISGINENDDSFTLFEKQAWAISAGPYHQLFEPFTRKLADILLNEVKKDNHEATSLLDLATGPGYLARKAKEYGYLNIVGVDLSNEMIAIAQQAQTSSYSASLNSSLVRFKVGDAEQLDEIDNSFDSVTMSFGLPHLPKPDKAISEVYRVLKPGGRFGCTAWAEPEQNIGFKLLLDAIDTFVDKTKTIPAGPPFFQFGNPGNSHNALEHAGFTNVTIKKINLEWVANSSDDFFNAFFKGGARIGGLLRLQSETTLNAIRNKIMLDSEVYKNGNNLHIPISVTLVIGTKPRD